MNTMHVGVGEKISAFQANKINPFREDEGQNDATRIRPSREEQQENNPSPTEFPPTITPAPGPEQVPEPQPGSSFNKRIGYTFIVAIILFLNTAFPGISIADSENKLTPKNIDEITSSDSKLSEEEFSVLFLRLQDIRKMDISSLTVGERRELRKEVKDIRHKVSESGVGIYLSTTLLIVILLLIILL